MIMLRVEGMIDGNMWCFCLAHQTRRVLRGRNKEGGMRVDTPG
jgi:hypothetical protein